MLQAYSAVKDNIYDLNSTESVINQPEKKLMVIVSRGQQYYQSGYAGIFNHFICTASAFLLFLKVTIQFYKLLFSHDFIS
jgi:hypothetical protein